ncbi:MAG: hypothetical protein HOI95_24890 [Chromatiales bacterium]|jgi:peptidyl-prolyl cis-trans isomerase D|nr:hypothetical protein [Chromatiales bacterium]
MLQAIRDKAQGWIAWVIVAVICLTFALWGVQEYFNVDPNVPVVAVNGEEIDLNMFNNAYQRDQLRQQSDISDDPLAQLTRRREFLDRMVTDALMIQSATANGLRISDPHLARTIRSEPAFQDAGVFSEARFSSFLRNSGFSESTFDFFQRRAMLANQVFSAVAISAFSANFETDKFLALRGQVRSYDTLIIDGANLDDAEPTDEEISAHFENNQADFRSAEQVKLSYVVLSKDGLAKDIKASDEVLQLHFKGTEHLYLKPEKRVVRHVLVAVAEDADAPTVAVARTKIDAARERIASGESFAEVAKTVSEDPSSAKGGGSLGSIGKGGLDPAVEAVAFSQLPSQLSEVIRSQFGFHLTMVDEVIGGGVPDFAEARDKVLADYRNTEAEKVFFEVGARLKDTTYTESGSLAAATDLLDLEVKESEYMGRDGISGHPVFGDQRVMRAAFSQEVLEERLNSDVLDHLQDIAVVVRVEDHRPSAALELSEVREQVAAAAKAMKTADVVNSIGETLVRELRQGLSKDDAASRVNAKWTSFTALTRYSRGPEPVAAELAFRMPHPRGGTKVFDGKVSGSSFVIVGLRSVNPGKAEAEASKQLVSSGLARDLGEIDVKGLLEQLKDGADIEVFESRL